ncbi:hypothetical protein Salat_0358700 [Sesamum alatum]|uniref:Uncharacterized protein n=1 Tax=Sesamum alatum TaxID=300844 RepID=A0AAE2CZI0_9LAMI|nr:hypothetical protein Salat_0358700 [Sesamum alatum]
MEPPTHNQSPSDLELGQPISFGKENAKNFPKERCPNLKLVAKEKSRSSINTKVCECDKKETPNSLQLTSSNTMKQIDGGVVLFPPSLSKHNEDILNAAKPKHHVNATAFSFRHQHQESKNSALLNA